MAHLKSLESKFRFVGPHFGPINSNCALRYLQGSETNSDMPSHVIVYSRPQRLCKGIYIISYYVHISDRVEFVA